MIKRTTALCDGEIVGIESIYTVVGDKQVNIPDKVEELRRKSQAGMLTCPCGCGAQLVLVAGEKSLRKQHFREKAGQEHAGVCQEILESETSILSKIILKCWLEDKLPSPAVKTRVPIKAISKLDRRVEITMLDQQNKVAISYTCDKDFLSDEKLDILKDNLDGIPLTIITDIRNSFIKGQYPEMMMKVQKRQGYCIFLEPGHTDWACGPYSSSKLHIVFFRQGENGLWERKLIIKDYLTMFSFSKNGYLMHSKYNLRAMIAKKKSPKAAPTAGTLKSASAPEIPKCPGCGSEMVRRKGKYGEFWGCKNYPSCKRIIRIADA